MVSSVHSSALPFIPGPRRPPGGAGSASLLAGRYLLVERLGERGISVHWRAYDCDLREVVTVKLLREALAGDDRMRARLRREVRIARRVTHPNVARVYGYERDGDRCFVVLEAAGGERLDEALRHLGPLPIAWARELARSLCEGLAAAHAAGVVHGAIRPAILLLVPGRGLVLTDFGDDGIDLEEPDAALYRAPERLAGARASPAGDVYSIGATLAALAGAHAPGWGELLAACRDAEPSRRPRDAAALLTRLRRLAG